MSKRSARLISLLTWVAAGAFAGSGCSDKFDCRESFDCEDPVMNGGAGGERVSPNDDDDDEIGGAGGVVDDVLTCEKGTFDCNQDPKDGCEEKAKSLKAPLRPESRRPLRSEYTGSLHARKTAPVLRPTFVWTESEVEAGCGELHYEIEVDDSCKPGELADCEFKSPELKAESKEATYTPSKDLPVSEVAPVGALYTWRVRACDEASCSEWSDPAPVNVGRTLQDLNGDGYGDAMLQSDKGTEIYLGGVTITTIAHSRISRGAEPKFVGDLNGDGFFDFSIETDAADRCGFSGIGVEIIFGEAELLDPKSESICRAAGPYSSSIASQHVGDLNGDGFDELAVVWASYNENTVLIFLGGETLQVQPKVEPAAANGEFVLGSSEQIFSGNGDYDGDGFQDFVGGGYDYIQANEIYVFLGGSTLSRDFEIIHQPIDCPKVIWTQMAGDMNSDGRDDWTFVCRDESSRIGLLHGGSAASSALSESWTSSLSLSIVSPIFDFDGDGERELFVGGEGASLFVWRPDLEINEELRGFISLFSNNVRIDVADHNGDGRPDILVGDGVGAKWAAASSSFNQPPISLKVPAGATKVLNLAF